MNIERGQSPYKGRTELPLKGCIVTVDALNCQRDIARQIVDQDGDYALSERLS